MSNEAVHREIAKERFLEMMAQEPNSDPVTAAVLAIEHADTFATAYAACGPVDTAAQKTLKGCKACFGSGGKANSPCRACAGTGKVPA